MEKQVGIIGAGISGLLACKYVLEMGFSPIVLEAKAGIGGVWSSQTIRTTKLQSQKHAYQFSDFPWPSSVTQDLPDHNQVLEYIESYARHFSLLSHIKFNSKVLSINYEGASEEEMASWDLWAGSGHPFSIGRKWTITTENTRTQSIKVYEVDFVILCMGKFSDIPNVPEFPPNKGPEAFAGKVVHAMHYSSMTDGDASEFVKGKRVTVVGAHKSGLDIARECAMENGVEKPCTLLYKEKQWAFPDYFPWGVPLAFLYFNRFAELMFHKPGEGFALCLLATLLSPLRWLISKFVESDIKWKLGLNKYNMVPKHSFNKDFSACTLALLPDNFYGSVEEGSIMLKKATTFSFCKDGLMIDADSAPLETDAVILATGYKGDEKLKNIFVSPEFQKYIMGLSSSTTDPLSQDKASPVPETPTNAVSGEGQMYAALTSQVKRLFPGLTSKSKCRNITVAPRLAVPLYRECIHPRIPQLAVLGYTEKLVHLYEVEMRCRWLAHLLKGTFRLPRIKEMEVDVLRWEQYMKPFTAEYHRRSCLSLMHIWFNDQLCRDMKCNPRRKKGFLSELFEPYGPMDYVNLCPH